MPDRMTAVDAQFHWMSAKISNGYVLLYAFDGVPADVDQVVDELHRRANACRPLTLRVDDTSPWTYPRWVAANLDADRIVRHDADTWDGCQAALSRLVDDQLDSRHMPWRIHLVAPVHGIPRSTGPGTVAMIQFAHALCDGPRATAMAAWLFGRDTPVPDVARGSIGLLPLRAIDAARTHRKRVDDTGAGLLPPAIGPQPAVRTNTAPTGARSVRTLVRHRAQLGESTATVATLAAVSGALSDHLGGSVSSLAAEVTMGKPGVPQANNHFANVTVGLYPGLSPAARMDRINTDLTNARRRAEHPAARAADRAFAATPAPLLRWGVGLFDPSVHPSAVAGNTVLSSLHRGPADLTLAGAPVLLTAVYPALSPAMGLVHGVWGIGDIVTVSVHAAESAVADIDAYVARLDAEL